MNLDIRAHYIKWNGVVINMEKRKRLQNFEYYAVTRLSLESTLNSHNLYYSLVKKLIELALS